MTIVEFEAAVFAQKPTKQQHYDENYWLGEWRAGDNNYSLETRRRIEAFGRSLAERTAWCMLLLGALPVALRLALVLLLGLTVLDLLKGLDLEAAAGSAGAAGVAGAARHVLRW